MRSVKIDRRDAKELVRFARTQGYRPEELAAIIPQLG
jgi:hypothetical protein